MSYAVYKIIHLVGIVMALSALAALAFTSAGGESNPANRKVAVITHGVGLLLALVAGFGLMAKAGLGFGDNLWIIAKIVIWLIVGGLVTAVRKRPDKAMVIWWSVPAWVAVAAWLVAYRPF